MFTRDRSACPHDEASPAVTSHNVDVPSPSVVAALAMVMLGFGVVLGGAAGPRAQDSLAASARPPITVIMPPAAAPASTPEPPPSEPAATPPSEPAATPPPEPAATLSPPESAGDASPGDAPPAPDPPGPDDGKRSKRKHKGKDNPVAPATQTPTAPRFKHVWLVMLSHVGYQEMYGTSSPATYLAQTLAPQGTLLSAYRPVTTGSGADAIAVLSGQDPHALPDQLTAAGLTWKSYVDVGLDALDADLSSADATPSFSYIAPSPCHDGRPAPCQDGAPAGPAAADAFLQTLVPKIQASAAYADGGLVVITSDEDGAGADGPVGALLLTREVKPGTVVDTPYDHYSLLKSIEDVFGLRYLGLAQRDAVKAFDARIWRASP